MTARRRRTARLCLNFHIKMRARIRIDSLGLVMPELERPRESRRGATPPPVNVNDARFGGEAGSPSCLSELAVCPSSADCIASSRINGPVARVAARSV